MDDSTGDSAALHREMDQVIRRRLASGAIIALRDPPSVARPNLTFEETVAAQQEIFAKLPDPVPTFGSNFATTVLQQMNRKRAPRMCSNGCGEKFHGKRQCRRMGAGRPPTSSLSGVGNERGEDLSNRQGNGEGQRRGSGEITEI
jgi:hypothetical protein